MIEQIRSLGRPEDGDDFLRDVVRMFLADVPARIAEMEEALRTGDSRRFARTAHTLKGSSANVGAVSVKTVAGALEQRSREHGLGGLEPGLAELQAAFDRTRDAFLRLLAGDGTTSPNIS